MSRIIKSSYDWRKEGVSQSLLTMFLSCRQKAKLSLAGYVPRQTSFPLWYGDVAHKILERIQGEQQKGKKVTPEYVVKVCRAVCVAIKKEKGERWNSRSVNDFELISAQTEAVLPGYFEFWGEKLKWLGIEHNMRVPFGETFLRGTLDGVILRGLELWLLDTKNRSRTGEELGDVLLRDFQINFYMLMFWLKTKKIPMGFLYNVIRRPGLKLGEQEELDDYIERIREHVDKDPSHYYKRYEVAVTKDDLLLFQKDLTGIVKEFGEWCDAGMPTRLYGNPCVGKFGKLCEFVPIDFEGNFVPFTKVANPHSRGNSKEDVLVEEEE